MTDHTARVMKPKNTIRRRLSAAMRKLDWHTSKHDNRITGRLYHLALDRHPWYDWGHPLMILVGDCVGGNYSEPTMPTWFYRQGPATRMRRTGYPRHPLSTYEIITDYSTFRERTQGLNEDEMYAWQAIYISQDGDLCLGHRFWGGNFYGLSTWDTALLRRYLRAWHRHDWWGLRSWLWTQGLHAAVHVRKPGACQAVPPRSSGGYDHWHCQLPRHHTGTHRYNAMVWGEVGGMDLGGVVHAPEEVRRG